LNDFIRSVAVEESFALC